LVNLTLATFLRAEFGFFGVVVYTLTHTPRFWGDPFKAGVLVFLTDFLRPNLTSWLIVGITLTAPVYKPIIRIPVPYQLNWTLISKHESGDNYPN
jgi:hypothetical protein